MSIAILWASTLLQLPAQLAIAQNTPIISGGIGFFDGVNAGAQRYFQHDASHLTPTEAARIAAVLPLPKKRGAVAPKGFVLRYGNTISRRIGAVHAGGYDSCLH